MRHRHQNTRWWIGFRSDGSSRFLLLSGQAPSLGGPPRTRPHVSGSGPSGTRSSQCEQGLTPVRTGPGQTGAGQGTALVPSFHTPPLPRRPGSPAPRHHMLQGRRTVRQGTVDNKRAPSVAPRDLDASCLLPGRGGRAATYLPGRALLHTAVGQILQVWLSFFTSTRSSTSTAGSETSFICPRTEAQRSGLRSIGTLTPHTQPTHNPQAWQQLEAHITQALTLFFSLPLLSVPVTQSSRQYRTRRKTPPNRLRSLHRVWPALTRRQHWTACCLALVPDPVTESHERGY